MGRDLSSLPVNMKPPNVKFMTIPMLRDFAEKFAEKPKDQVQEKVTEYGRETVVKFEEGLDLDETSNPLLKSEISKDSGADKDNISDISSRTPSGWSSLDDLSPNEEEVQSAIEAAYREATHARLVR